MKASGLFTKSSTKEGEGMNDGNRPAQDPDANARAFRKALAIGMAISAAVMVLLDLLGVIDIFKNWP